MLRKSKIFTSAVITGTAILTLWSAVSLSVSLPQTTLVADLVEALQHRVNPLSYS